MDASRQTMPLEKEIDIQDIELEQINVDYVWTMDVPVPLQAVPKKGYYEATPQVFTIGYTASEQRQELCDFYEQQMELLGWQSFWQTDSGLEAMLLFKKPHKQCAISIRPGNRKKHDIIIMQQTV